MEPSKDWTDLIVPPAMNFSVATVQPETGTANQGDPVKREKSELAIHSSLIVQLAAR
jgi:hypothetical protein